MIKKYTSKSTIAINVPLGEGKNIHVSFGAVTGGGSVYYTNDEALQVALEKHHQYGRLFKLQETIDEQPASVDSPEGGEDATDKPTETLHADAGNVVHVDGLDDAKEYLCEHFGISRTKLRTKASIIDAATSNGIVFDGIE